MKAINLLILTHETGVQIPPPGIPVLVYPYTTPRVNIELYNGLWLWGDWYFEQIDPGPMLEKDGSV